MSYMTGRRRLHRRGTALLMAVLMISIVGGSLAALTLAFAAQAKRTTRQAHDAQLRQLLFAGQVAAQQSIGQSKSGEVALPPDLRSAGASVRYETVQGDAADEMQFHIVASLGEGRSMTQTLRFARAGDRWELRAAEL
jgi:type II secretory pathway component PulK